MYQSDFPIFTTHPDLIYLDNASTTQKPQYVIDRVDHYITHDYANIHRGIYDLAEQSELLYEQSKKMTAKHLGCHWSQLIYHYNATACANMLVDLLIHNKVVWPWDTVRVGLRDHHATIVPRQLMAERIGCRIEYIPFDAQTYDMDREWVEERVQNAELRIQNTDEKSKNLTHQNSKTPKACFVCHASNVTGQIYDVARLRGLLWDDVFVAVDASQSVPHFPVDVMTIGCDALFFTAHKMMAYTWLGILYLTKKYIQSRSPTQGGGGIIDTVTTDGCSLQVGVSRFEPGTPNLIAAVSLLAAWEYIEQIGGYKVLQAHEHILTLYCLDNFAQRPWITLVGSDDVSVRTSTFSLSLPCISPLVVWEYLASQGICVRGGGHCAHPLLHHLGYDHGVIRMSLGLSNTREDCEKFFSALDDFHAST